MTEAEARAVRSYQASDQTYLCIHCGGWQRHIESEIRAIRSKVSPERITTWALFEELEDDLREQTSAEREKRMAAVRARRRGRDHHRISRHSRSRLSTPNLKVVAAQIVRGWRQGCAWELHECQICGLLLMDRAGGSTRRHGACWNEWRASDNGRAWSRRMLAVRRDTIRPRRTPAPSFSRRRGRPRASEDLSRNFRWTVLALLGRETRSLLAAEAGVDPSVVRKAVADTLKLLPEADRVDVRFRPYVELLRAAAESV